MKLKRMLAGMLAGIMVFSIAGCGTTEKSNKKDNTSNSAIADIWSAPASVKVLATADASDYEDVRTDEIHLTSGKNEYESGQIIVSAKKELSFTVELSDLVDENNEDHVISKDHFTVYIQKYISVLRNSYGNGAPLGDYPDAILPQENAVKYEQNVVKEGANGGAWLEFFIPEETVAGNYKGTATITIGETKETMPISLKVYDVTVPAESTQKSLFTVNYHCVNNQELDSSYEMQEKYFDMLIRYRCSPTGIDMDNADIEDWAEMCYTYCQKGMSTIGLPSGGSQLTLDDVQVFNYEILADRIVILAKKSLETNYNMISKCAFYNFWIDEPFCVAYPDGKVAAYVKAFELCIERVLAELKSDPEFTGAFAQELLEDISKIPNVVTDYNTDEYGNSYRSTGVIKNADGSLYSYTGTSANVCPKPDAYNTEKERNTYNIEGEHWWYTCNEPKYPYPTYHIDDSMTSAAVIGWMMADYNIVGNLYWVVNYHVTDGAPMEDAYGMAERGAGANGDGVLLYPGKLYEVDGPVASIRLDAIRDGYEDYELIRMLKDGYASLAKDSQAVVSQMTGTLYNGSSMIGDSAEYESARELLLQILEMLQSPAHVTIDSITKEDTSGGEKYVFAISGADGTEVYSDDTLLSAENGVYHVEKFLTESENYLHLKVEKEGIEYQMKLYLGGKQMVWASDSMGEDNVTGDIAERMQEGDYYKLTSSVAGGKWKVNITHESLQQISENTAHYLMKIYAEKETAYTVYVTYSGFGKMAAQEGTLQAGENQIDLDFFTTVNWARNKSLTDITIVFEDGTWIGLGELKLYEV